MADDDARITIHLTVTGAQGAPRLPLSISKTVTPSALRKQVSEETKIPLTSLKLIFRGRLIADDDSKAAVAEYKLDEGSVVHCMGKPQSDEAAPPAAAAPSATTTAAAAPFMPTIPTTAASTPAVPTQPVDPLKAAFQTLRASCSPPDYLTAVTTLEKILDNIASNPMEEKYRKVKKNNAAFQRRLGGRNGGDAAMKAVGFVTQQDDGEEVYMMQASADAWPKLMASKAAVEAAVRQAKTAAQQPAPQQIPTNMPNFGSMGAGGMPDFGSTGGMGAGGMGSPEMQRAAAELMSNPAQLEAMLQNPMVQNMLRNHPQFANNPMGQQMLEQMMSNPAMLAQMSQMMRDPNAMNQMQSMMQAGSNNLSVPQVPQQQSQTSNNPGQQSSGESDEQMTEEEMLAEAIRRSLQEQ